MASNRAIPSTWKNSAYLRSGSLAQQEAYRVLHRYQLLERLTDYDPILVGTFPLDIAVPGSDLDIICEVHDIPAFQATAEAYFSQYPDYTCRKTVINDVPSLVISFWVQSVEVELFAQPLATERQNGYRHLVVEARLLTLGGSSFKTAVIQLKTNGVKTEPAFAQLLNLPGNPYLALLELEGWSDEALLKRIQNS